MEGSGWRQVPWTFVIGLASILILITIILFGRASFTLTIKCTTANLFTLCESEAYSRLVGVDQGGQVRRDAQLGEGPRFFLHLHAVSAPSKGP